MRNFHCDNCGQAVFFENVSCERCHRVLAYLPDEETIAALERRNDGLMQSKSGKTYRLCTNYEQHHVCNWAIRSDDPNPLCNSCRLTSVIPQLSKPENLFAWNKLEAAKRRLVYSLHAQGLPIHNRMDDPSHGLVFKFMADGPNGKRVLTGHDEGVITLNIDEADDVVREQRRISMHEPYRTLLGHFRHEIGHYYWDVLVKGSPRLHAFRERFGNEEIDYQSALKEHYANGPRPDWRAHFVSAYASVHPWEDWAETWAHYMHMTDTLETAGCCGLSLHPNRNDEPLLNQLPCKPARELSFDQIIAGWFPLTYALYNLNRGMGLVDLYPFILPPPAIDKLRFVHETICQAGVAEPAMS